MILALLLQAAVAGGGDRPSSEIVVNGERLTRTRQALNRCLEMRCPPIADINATIAHADNQFMAGDFHGARETLAASRRRNKRYAAAYPVAVSELLRADAFVALLVGQSEYARVGMIDAVSALKTSLAADYPRVLEQRLQVAAIFARQSSGDTAINMLDAIAVSAHDKRLPLVEAEARLRAAAVYATLSQRRPELRAEARSRLAALRAMSAPEARPFSDAAVLVDLRLAQLDGDPDAVAQAKAQVARVDRAILIYAPEIDLASPLIFGNVRRIYDTKDQWVDLRYVVAPDGAVRDITEVNRGRDANGRWIEVAKESVANRQYLPLAQAPDGPGIEKLERFVFTSAFDSRVGSRIRLPYGMPQLQSIDLSPREAGGDPPRG